MSQIANCVADRNVDQEHVLQHLVHHQFALQTHALRLHVYLLARLLVRLHVRLHVRHQRALQLVLLAAHIAARVSGGDQVTMARIQDTGERDMVVGGLAAVLALAAALDMEVIVAMDEITEMIGITVAEEVTIEGCSAKANTTEIVITTMIITMITTTAAGQDTIAAGTAFIEVEF